MRKGRSTSKPKKEEQARIVACKEGPCMACQVLREQGLDGCDGGGCDYHHAKSGNVRRGHMFGCGLCGWHHRGIPLDGFNASTMRSVYGPSLMDGGRRFAAEFGDDETLLERQNAYLEKHA